MAQPTFAEGYPPRRNEQEIDRNSGTSRRAQSVSGPRPLPGRQHAHHSGNWSSDGSQRGVDISYNLPHSNSSSPNNPLQTFATQQPQPYASSRSPHSQQQSLNETQFPVYPANHTRQFNPYEAANQPPNFGAPQPPDEASSMQVVQTKFAEFVGDEGNTLHNGLNANQVTMIALGCTFGTGLLVGSGSALHEGGPLGLLISYIFVCSICYCVMTSLGEMATHVHHKKGFIGSVSSYVHPSVGFALGWTYLSQFFFIPAGHINTASIIMHYIGFRVDLDENITTGHETPIPPNAWRIIFITIVVGINCLGIRAFGHFEFWLSTFKVCVLVTLIVFGLVIDMGAGPLKTDDPHLWGGPGGYFWRPPHGPFGHPTWAYVNWEGGLQLFWGFWSTQVRALFALMGIELLGVIVGEVANPRISVPKAVRRTCALVFTLYLFGVAIIGLICSSQDKTFMSENPIVSHGGLKSPFIIAANRLVVRGIVPSVCGAIVIFALSSATSNFYTGTRILHGLALDGQAPAVFKNVTAAGRPVLALGVLMAFCFICYVGDDENTNVFEYVLDLTTTAGAIGWICILWAHIRFRKMLKMKGVRLDTLRYRAPLHPIGTWLALLGVIVITLFKGIGPYANRGVRGVIVAYLCLLIFVVLIFVHKHLYGGSFTDLSNIDVQKDMEDVIAEEEEWEERQRNGNLPPWWKRLSEYI